MLIRKIVVRQIVDIEIRVPVRLIVNALPPLLFHHGALVIHIGLRHRQRTHAIGFEKQSKIELVLGQFLKIIRPVLVRRTVHPAAVIKDEDEMFALPHVLRSLKHHVFEKVCIPGVARRLVPTAHVVSHIDCVNRRAMIRHQNHPQPIVQMRIVQLELRHLDAVHIRRNKPGAQHESAQPAQRAKHQDAKKGLAKDDSPHGPPPVPTLSTNQPSLAIRVI